MAYTIPIHLIDPEGRRHTIEGRVGKSLMRAAIDAGVEDEYLGEDLYRRIMEEFLRRLERKRLGIED